jgi:hypothetical protein
MGPAAAASSGGCTETSQGHPSHPDVQTTTIYPAPQRRQGEEI